MPALCSVVLGLGVTLGKEPGGVDAASVIGSRGCVELPSAWAVGKQAMGDLLLILFSSWPWDPVLLSCPIPVVSVKWLLGCSFLATVNGHMFSFLLNTALGLLVVHQ